jgi:hypothetical protein
MIHDCCGCSCFVCEGKHRGGYHTVHCIDRLFKEAVCVSPNGSTNGITGGTAGTGSVGSKSAVSVERAVSRCRECGHEQELSYSWCLLCGDVRLDIVSSFQGLTEQV